MKVFFWTFSVSLAATAAVHLIQQSQLEIE